MIIYQGSSEEFNQDVIQNQIADKIAKNFEEAFHRINESEYRSWAHSLAILNNSFIYAGLKDNHVVVEYELPYASQRIDVLLFGHDATRKENIVILELKQWSNDNVKESESEGNVKVNYKGSWIEHPHPALQVQGYFFGLKDFIKIFEEKNAPELSASVYAHNYSKQKDAIILSYKFSELVKTFP